MMEDHTQTLMCDHADTVVMKQDADEFQICRDCGEVIGEFRVAVEATRIYKQFRNLIGARAHDQGVEGMTQGDIEQEAYLVIDWFLREHPSHAKLDTDQMAPYLSHMLKLHTKYLRLRHSRNCRTLNSTEPEFVYNAVADGLSLGEEYSNLNLPSTPADAQVEYSQSLQEVYECLEEDEAALLSLIMDPPIDVFRIMDSFNWQSRPSTIPNWVWNQVLASKLGRTVSRNKFRELIIRVREIVAACFDRMDLISGEHSLSSSRTGVSSIL